MMLRYADIENEWEVLNAIISSLETKLSLKINKNKTKVM